MFQIKDKTYPDGTKSTATVPVTVIAPNVPDVIYVPKGDKVPDPSTVVTNSNDIKTRFLTRLTLGKLRQILQILK